MWKNAIYSLLKELSYYTNDISNYFLDKKLDCDWDVLQMQFILINQNTIKRLGGH